MENELTHHAEIYQFFTKIFGPWNQNPNLAEWYEDGVRKVVDDQLKKKEQDLQQAKLDVQQAEQQLQEAELDLQVQEAVFRNFRNQAPAVVLLTALAANSIELSERQKEALLELPCESLPPFELALKAKDADEFVQQAGLHREPNGSGDDRE